MWYLTDIQGDCCEVVDTEDYVVEYVTERGLKKIARQHAINGVDNDTLHVRSLYDIATVESTVAKIAGNVYCIKLYDKFDVLKTIKDEDKWKLYLHCSDEQSLFLYGLTVKSAVIKLPYGITDVYMYTDDTVIQVSGVRELIMPDTIRFLWDGYLFQSEDYVKQLGYVRLSANLVYIGSSNFASMPIKEIELPDSLQYISSFAFYECKKLRSVILPKNLVCIDVSAFNECSALESVDFSKVQNIECIGDGAFGVTGIKEIVLPEGLTSIAPKLFHKCYCLYRVVIPSTVLVIGCEAFHECVKLVDCVIPDRITSIDRNAFSMCSELTELTLPKSMLVLERAIWAKCSKLKKLNLPETVQEMSVMLVNECRSLTQIKYPKVENVDYLINAVRTHIFPDSSVYLPRTFYEFWGCKSLKVVSMGAAQYYAYKVCGCSKALYSNSVLKYEIRPDERYKDLTIVVKDLFADNAIRHTLIVPEGTEVDFSGYANVDSVSLIYRG